MKKWLIGCEQSGVVTAAFRARGHEAYSCDLLPADPAHPCPEFHLQMDVRKALRLKAWDGFIVHPNCQYLCSSGLHWNKRIPGRQEETEAALVFVQEMLDAPVKFIALENPRGCIGTRIRPSTQMIQPHQFGDDASKETHLWLKTLPPLSPTKMVPGRRVTLPNGKTVSRWANQTDSGQNRLGPSEDRWKLRSRTYDGIADAFADQWGHLNFTDELGIPL